ncbi:hypothetical protein QVD17_07325 [Tagetes erecta]|uniref:RRM domain-containing protein n=1 Tax=Tagetes erecta TaxID=13708 RepID=A0AAD8PCW0_TARER|nr:hypothetical protein QVD17_07325 [Tagetes erecta]
MERESRNKGDVNGVNVVESNGEPNNLININIKDHNQKGGHSPSNITSFYISNLPGKCNIDDLRIIFKEFGKIKEIFLANKKNREGYWFRFVRFIGVTNSIELEAQMQGIKYFNRILQLNIAKYNRNGQSMETPAFPGERDERPPKNYTSNVSLHQNRRNLNDRCSFLDALVNNSGRPKEKVITIDLGEDSVMKEKYSGSIIARAKSFSILGDMQALAKAANIPILKIRYLGGLFILLSFSSQPEADLFLRERQIWDGWFTKVEAWRGQSIPYERFAWLRIHGVPHHLWNPNVFNNIGSSYGRLLQPPESKWEDVNLSYECIGVLEIDSSGNNCSNVMGQPEVDKTSLGLGSSPSQNLTTVTGVKGLKTFRTASPINASLIEKTTLEVDVSASMLRGQHHFAFLGFSPPQEEQRCTPYAGKDCHAFIAKGGPDLTKRARRFKKPKMGPSTAPPGGLYFDYGSSSGPDKAQRPNKIIRPMDPVIFHNLVDNPYLPSLPPCQNSTESSSDVHLNPGSTQLASTKMACTVVLDSIIAFQDQVGVGASVQIEHGYLGGEGVNLIINIEEEVMATKMVAECIGVQLNGHEQLIKDAIVDDGATRIDQ